MKTVQEKVEELIQFINNTMKEMRLDATDVFMNGNCGNMYTIFAKFFRKEAVIPYEILYNGEPYHIFTKINEDFYDISGKTSLDKYIDYLRKNNSNMEFSKRDFELKEIDISDRYHRIKQQSNMYAYDEDYEQSCIENQMNSLNRKIEELIKSKEAEI